MSRYISDFTGAMNEVYKRDIHELFMNVDNFFCRANCSDLISLNQIEDYLKSKNISYTKKQLNACLNILMCEFSSIIRHDTYSGKVSFQKLDERHQDTKFSKGYYDFSDDSIGNKRFVLISDTHIGNPQVQSFEIIKGIYDYCLKNGIGNVFHLGDLFDGIKPCVVENRIDYFDEQIKIFLENYPDKAGINTYSICGNHDEIIHGKDNIGCILNINGPTYRDLRTVSRDISTFNFYSDENIHITFANKKFRFGHRLYINPLVQRKVLHCVDEIASDIKKTSNKFPVCISGHLHNAFIFFDTDCYGEDKCFISVPSTSLHNSDGVVGFNIELIDSYGELDKMIITELCCNNGSTIYEGESYEYSFKEKNKSLRKEYIISQK